jgi:hypothetical protein
MIFETTELSPEQKAVIEELLGRQLLDREAVSLRAFEPPTVSETQQRAVEELRRFLETPGRPQPGVSDEELDAAITEAMRTVRPHYTPVE